jgi:hypothetical protein
MPSHHHHRLLPIFTLQRVEGPALPADGLDRGFALLGALDLLDPIAPVLASFASAREHTSGATPS